MTTKELVKTTLIRTGLTAVVWWIILLATSAGPRINAQNDAEQALTEPPLTDIFTNNPQGEAATEIGKLTKKYAIDENQWAVQRIIDLFFDSDLNTPEQKATYYIKGVVNLFLSIIGFVALIYVIYGFYKMFASEGEDGWSEAKKIVIRWGIALAVIGIAWFIVSRFFKIYQEAIEPVAYSEPVQSIDHIV